MSDDVLVIGGGVMGLFTAYRASELGARVTVLERGRIGDPMTASYGRTRSFRSDYLDADYVRFAREAIRLWGEFEAETGATGAGPLRVHEHRQGLGHAGPRPHLRGDEPAGARPARPADHARSTAPALRERFPYLDADVGHLEAEAGVVDLQAVARRSRACSPSAACGSSRASRRSSIEPTATGSRDHRRGDVRRAVRSS